MGVLKYFQKLSKGYFLLYFLLGWLISTALGCTKAYTENPTCHRYLELSYKYDGEMNQIPGHFPDTLWPNGRLGNYACDSELLKLQNYQPHPEGCAAGWQIIQYEIKGV